MPEHILQIEVSDAPTFNALDEFTRAYVHCLFFTDDSPFDSEEWEAMQARGEEIPEGNFPADCTFGDLSPEALESIKADCAEFQRVAADLLARAYQREGYGAAQAGHDFWLTRNGHGAGFWDRKPLDAEGLGDALSELCGFGTKFSNVDSYYGDDSRIHLA